MTIKDDYIMSIDNPGYNIDKDISIEIYYQDNSCYVSIYNDTNDSNVSFCVGKDKLRGLADFLYETIGGK
jgi:hypothetical protein